MSYRFNGTSDYVQFALGALSGATFGTPGGPVTVAMLVKRNSAATTQRLVNISDSTGSTPRLIFFVTAADFRFTVTSGGSGIGPQNPNSTSIWYLLVGTYAGSGNIRFHVHDGSSWNHANRSGGSDPASAVTVAGSDLLHVGVSNAANFQFLAGDIVCLGIKKANSTDLQVETLSRTAFSAWASFGFDWLIGFDTSLVSAGKLQDQSATGTGDEITKVGTSVVSDPPGWSWTVGPPPAAPSALLAFT